MILREKNLYNNLMIQYDANFKSNNQKSFQTRQRYKEAFSRFAEHLAVCYGTQNIRNISSKHIISYVDQQLEREISSATLKVDLAGLRYIHQMIPNKKYDSLISNRELELEQRKRVGNRAWDEEEYLKVLDLAKSQGREDIYNAVRLGNEFGLRIHETATLHRSTLERAVRDRELVIKGKGGKIRTLTVTDDNVGLVKEIMSNVKHGDPVFTQEKATHTVIKSIQNFLYRHQDKIRDSDHPSGNRLTYHGLRYNYAQRVYKYCLDNDMSVAKAERLTSERLGHNRREVTRIYIDKV